MGAELHAGGFDPAGRCCMDTDFREKRHGFSRLWLKKYELF
jgi:hypothetical protein